jgi:formate dehydrogenase major subunit
MDEIARLTPGFCQCLLRHARQARVGTVAVRAGGVADHARQWLRARQRASSSSPNISRPTRRPGRASRCSLRRAASCRNVGAQTRRTANSLWHKEDLLEIHPHDAEQRGIRDGDWVRLASRSGETTLRAQVTDRVAPGVVYTTFHHPDTQANVITTDYSDWATNCPEYKVTAVQVSPSNGPSRWQEDYEKFSRQSRRIASAEAAE